MKVLLIDGDTFAYAAALAVEKAVEWEPGQWTYTADAEEAMHKLDADLETVGETLEADKLVIALSDSTENGWRRTVYPAYKANRKAVRKPLVLEAMRKHLLEVWKAYLRPTLEGDDVLGILATHPTLIKGDKKIIVSIDKDMETVPGRHYNPDTGEKKIVSEDEANFHHLMQTLTGDTVDGYPGCPGIGPVKANDLLAGTEREFRWQEIVKAYEKKGLTEEDALVQARIARICRADDYDFKTKKVKLWTPPTS